MVSEQQREVAALLRHLDVVDESATFVPLTGGVSSDIWRLDSPDGVSVVVKRALSVLKVAAHWEAPIERNRFEVEWIRTVAGIDPTLVPEVLAHDPDSGIFVMSWFDPAQFPVWKSQLGSGIVNVETARQVGRALARIHAATAGDEDVRGRFDSWHIFDPIRIEPYLDTTGRAHPDLAHRFTALRDSLTDHRQALVHGDVSPKNILVGPVGPVFLDSECATWGDPVFDIAFCANHLLLKCLWVPGQARELLACFDVLLATYLDGVSWESVADIAGRLAGLLPALLLARIDGKSPVEYLDEHARRRVRATARTMLGDGVASPDEVRDAWASEVLSGA